MSRGHGPVRLKGPETPKAQCLPLTSELPVYLGNHKFSDLNEETKSLFTKCWE